jgi:hypothetical protein
MFLIYADTKSHIHCRNDSVPACWTAKYKCHADILLFYTKQNTITIKTTYIQGPFTTQNPILSGTSHSQLKSLHQQ